MGRPAASSPRRRHPSGAVGRRAQLGLSILLAARRHPHALRADARRLHRRGGRMARVAAARRRRRARSAAGHVRAAAANAASPNTRCPGCPDTKAHDQSESATPPIVSCSSTSTARSWTRCTARVGSESRPIAGPGHLQREILASLESRWTEPDEGIWEVRGPRRHFTHSQVMAWVAFDRGIKSAEMFGLEGPTDRWKQIRATEIHAEVCARGYDRGPKRLHAVLRPPDLDASLLMVPLVGFLPATDPRVIGTVGAIERELVEDGFVLRYRTEHGRGADGLPPGEGVFLPVQLLAGGRLRRARSRRRRRWSLRTAPRTAQRCRAAVRGIRSGGRANARELPAGLLASRPRQHGLQPERDPRAARASSSRRRRR